MCGLTTVWRNGEPLLYDLAAAVFSTCDGMALGAPLRSVILRSEATKNLCVVTHLGDSSLRVRMTEGLPRARRYPIVGASDSGGWRFPTSS